MRDVILYCCAATLLNGVVVMNFRIPDERFNVLLLLVPTFVALVIGVPMWLFLAAELNWLAGILAIIAPLFVVPLIERVVSPRRRVWLSWVFLMFGVVCARSAVHSASWLW